MASVGLSQSVHPKNGQLNGLRLRNLRATAASRRQLVLLTTWPAFLGYTGTNDATTVFNSVLSGYGLPSFSQGKDFRLLDDFELPYTLEYPKAWVVRPNSQREGIYISDFKTADKACVEILPAPLESEIVDLIVRAAVSPGRLRDAEKMGLPSPESIQVDRVTLESREYYYLRFASDTVTNSGYNIQRDNYAVAAVQGSQLVTLVASSRSDLFDASKAALLVRIIQSFRVR